MADDSELDYIRTFLGAIHKGTLIFNDTVASVVTATKTVVLTTNGATLNQYAGYHLFVTGGDNTGDTYTVVTCTLATPTTLVVAEAIEADLAADTVTLYTGVTVKQIEEAGNLSLINDTQKMLVLPPEIVGIYATRVLKRYLVKISETTEATLTAAINNVQIGIEKCNRRTAIIGWTKPSAWCYIKFINSNKAFCNFKTKRYDIDIYIDVEWSTE